MIIKCTIAGNLILNKLNFKIYGGQIYDLSEFFSDDIIADQLRPPNGDLFCALKNHHIEKLKSDTFEYRMEQRKKNIEQIPTPSNSIALQYKNDLRLMLLGYYRKGMEEAITYIRNCPFDGYDFLLEIKEHERRPGVIAEIENKLESFSRVKIESEFVLL